mmetsp:Transcript_32237/g.71258  ORF Transcript_32237/g.71258 Transcript_32237/m.71258 type:complete len:202 (-) Transcript_32237:78-683(-)
MASLVRSSSTTWTSVRAARGACNSAISAMSSHQTTPSARQSSKLSRITSKALLVSFVLLNCNSARIITRSSITMCHLWAPARAALSRSDASRLACEGPFLAAATRQSAIAKRTAVSPQVAPRSRNKGTNSRTNNATLSKRMCKRCTLLSIIKEEASPILSTMSRLNLRASVPAPSASARLPNPICASATAQRAMTCPLASF